MKSIEEHLKAMFVGKMVKFHDSCCMYPSETKGIVTNIKFDYDTCYFYLKNYPKNYIEICFSGDSWGFEIID